MDKAQKKKLKDILHQNYIPHFELADFADVTRGRFSQWINDSSYSEPIETAVPKFLESKNLSLEG